MIRMYALLIFNHLLFDTLHKSLILRYLGLLSLNKVGELLNPALKIQECVLSEISNFFLAHLHLSFVYFSGIIFLGLNHLYRVNFLWDVCESDLKAAWHEEIPLNVLHRAMLTAVRRV